jgi:hypothetical protein
VGFKPSEVQDLEISLSDQNVSLYWQPPVDEGSGPIIGYYVYRKSTNGSEELISTLSAKVTDYLDRNVSSGQTYYYSVNAFNIVGEGPLSDFVSIDIPVEKDEDMIGEVEENEEVKREEDDSWIYLVGMINIIIILIILAFVFLVRKKGLMNNKMQTRNKRIRPQNDLPLIPPPRF